MTSINLNSLAQKLNLAIGQMRKALPGVSDDQILVIARALNGFGVKVPVPVDFRPPNVDKEKLGAAVLSFLRSTGTASRGEVVRALTRQGVIEGTSVDYGRIGDFMTSNIYVERVHRGLYRYRKTPVQKVELAPKPPRKRVRKAKMTPKAAPVKKPTPLPVKAVKPALTKTQRPDLKPTEVQKHGVEFVLKQIKSLKQPFLAKELKPLLKCNTGDLVRYLKELHVAGKIKGHVAATNGTKVWHLV
jgi:hypothetical protein